MKMSTTVSAALPRLVHRRQPGARFFQQRYDCPVPCPRGEAAVLPPSPNPVIDNRKLTQHVHTPYSQVAGSESEALAATLASVARRSASAKLPLASVGIGPRNRKFPPAVSSRRTRPLWEQQGDAVREEGQHQQTPPTRAAHVRNHRAPGSKLPAVQATSCSSRRRTKLDMINVINRFLKGSPAGPLPLELAGYSTACEHKTGLTWGPYPRAYTHIEPGKPRRRFFGL